MRFKELLFDIFIQISLQASQLQVFYKYFILNLGTPKLPNYEVKTINFNQCINGIFKCHIFSVRQWI